MILKRLWLLLKIMLLALALFTLLEFVFYLIRWILTGKGVDTDNFPAYFKPFNELTEQAI